MIYLDQTHVLFESEFIQANPGKLQTFSKLIRPDTPLDPRWNVANVKQQPVPYKSPSTFSRRKSIASLVAMRLLAAAHNPRDASSCWHSMAAQTQSLICKAGLKLIIWDRSRNPAPEAYEAFPLVSKALNWAKVPGSPVHYQFNNKL